MPNITVEKYLKNIRNKYNVKIFINETKKKVKILLGEEIIKDESYIDISDIVEENIENISTHCEQKVDSNPRIVESNPRILK